ncbi:MAG: ribonuclease HI [Verrucomicrobiota bacterium]|nr:ribonuclease HI [Verrucomicrobiota bacterium]
MKKIEIYTDGACSGNPGPGGYGTVLCYNKHRKELSGGFRKTTNNRMEITAVIEGLKLLKEPCKGIIYSDSKYVVNSIEKGWAKRWKKKGWMRNKDEKARNADLWNILLELYEKHKLIFKWVKGHSDNKLNNRCDQLATNATKNKNLSIDNCYEVFYQ